MLANSYAGESFSDLYSDFENRETQARKLTKYLDSFKGLGKVQRTGEQSMTATANVISRYQRFRVRPSAPQGKARSSSRETLERLLSLRLDEKLLRQFQDTFDSEDLPLETLLALIEASIPTAELLRMAQKLIAAQPREPDSMRVLALAFGALGQTAFAVASAQRAVKLAPHDVQIAEEFAHWQRLAGCLLANTAWLSKAALVFDELSEREPLHCDFPFQAGLLKLDLGLLKQAEASFRQAIARYPRHARAHKFLGQTLQGQGRGSESQNAFLRAAELFTMTAREAAPKRSQLLFDEARDSYAHASAVGYSEMACESQLDRIDALESDTARERA